MDQGFIFVLGALLGALGTALLLWLLLVLDTDAAESISAHWSRLGGWWAKREAQDVSSTKGHVYRETLDSGRAPGRERTPEFPRPGLLILLALLLSGCASVGGGGEGGHVVALAVTGELKTPQPSPSPRTEELPVCGMEDPYLPDPCRIEVTKGEWLRVSNAGPEKPQKHHSKWWWLLISLVTL